jgi:copper transporter 1
MLFNWYTIDACFLTSSWQINSNGAFAATCIGVMLMVVMLEALRRLGKEFDDHLLREFQARLELLTASATPGEQHSVTFRTSPLQQLVRAVIHAATFGLAYIVMLLAMYYNGYIIICIFIGAGLGKFVCDWMTKTVVVVGGGTGSKCGNTGPQAVGIEEPSVCCG